MAEYAKKVISAGFVLCENKTGTTNVLTGGRTDSYQKPSRGAFLGFAGFVDSGLSTIVVFNLISWKLRFFLSNRFKFVEVRPSAKINCCPIAGFSVLATPLLSRIFSFP